MPDAPDAATDDRPVVFRNPRLEDAAAIWKLIDESRVLDTNSTYLYLLLCHHFSETCLVGELQHTIVAFLSAYKPPKKSDTIFVWQIAVHPRVRRRGVALAMLNLLINGSSVNGTAYIEATITPSNVASKNLFTSLAAKHGVRCIQEDQFASYNFGDQTHEEEILFRLGPFNHGHRLDGNSE